MKYYLFGLMLFFSYFLFVKLFFIVGILWVFEIIAWASSGTHIPIYWQIMDTMNCLQPVAVFFVFIFKYETINSLAEKYPSIKRTCTKLFSC